MKIQELHIFSPFNYYGRQETIPTSGKVASVYAAIFAFGIVTGGLLIGVFYGHLHYSGTVAFSIELSTSFYSGVVAGVVSFYLASYAAKKIHPSLDLDDDSKATNRLLNQNLSCSHQPDYEKSHEGNSIIGFIKEGEKAYDFSDEEMVLVEKTKISLQQTVKNLAVSNALMVETALPFYFTTQTSAFGSQEYKSFKIGENTATLSFKSDVLEAGGKFKTIRKGVIVTVDEEKYEIDRPVVWAKTIIGKDKKNLKYALAEENAAFQYKCKEGIVQSYGHFKYINKKGQECHVILLEYFNGGDLGSNIQDFKRLNLKTQRLIQRQLLVGLLNIHNAGFIHRDLKLENILVNRSNDIWKVAISDFGFEIPENQQSNLSGTPTYMSPEVCKQVSNVSVSYSQKCDVWAMGIIFYEMLHNAHPFEKLFHLKPEDQVLLINHLCKDNFIKEPKDQMSFEHLIWEMLQTDPDKRITTEQALTKLDALILSEN